VKENSFTTVNVPKEIPTPEELEQLARMRFGKAVEAITTETQSRLAELAAKYPYLGTISGRLEDAKLDIHLDDAEKKCRAMYEVSLDLLVRRKDYISRDDIDFIMGKSRDVC
jgi:hypothetical protein